MTETKTNETRATCARERDEGDERDAFRATRSVVETYPKRRVLNDAS